MVVTTGLKKLDVLLGGGFPEGSSVLIEGAPGTGKEEIAMQFLFTNMAKSKGYYMFYGQNASQLKTKFKNFGMDISKLSNITWFDTNSTCKEKDTVNCSMEDLTTLALAMSQFYEKNNGNKIAGIVTVLSPGLMMMNPIVIYRFLYDMIQKLKKYNANAVFLLEEGMHKTDTVIAMEGLCDFVMQTKFIEKEVDSFRTLRVKKSTTPVAPKFHKIELTSKGVIME